MNMNGGTHFQRIALGAILGLFAIYCDHAHFGFNLSLWQQALWTFTVIGSFLIELRRTLVRLRPALLAFVFLSVHIYWMYVKRGAFPFHPTLTVILCAYLETLVVGVAYIRLCQSIDPAGPFGLTAAEKLARKS